jgi:hypothetical protein
VGLVSGNAYVDRAWWLGPVNTLLAPVEWRRPATPVGFARLVRAAAHRTGAADLPPDPAFQDGMRVLYEALLTAPLTPIGRAGARDEIGRRLANRYGLRRLLDRHPDVAALPVDRPVVVTGLPRTGTTLLHGLLARHQGARAPLLWELLHPVADTAAQRRRGIRAARRAARFSHAGVPALRDIHPLDPYRPEECIFALPHHFGHLTRTPMPGYRSWCAVRDADEDYRYLRCHLQALQWRRPARRWVLKSPFHLHHLDALLRAFPDATVVWTHRDPIRALASWCSLVEAIMLLQNDRVDRARIGSDWLDIWSDGLRKAMEVRAAAPERFVDVDYDRLVADPAGTVAGLWRDLGDPMGPGTEAGAGGHRHRPGRHRYALERYGLDPDEVGDRLAIGSRR